MQHDRGMAGVARRVEKRFKKAYPGICINWEMPIKKNKNGTAGGRARVYLEGYRTKVILVKVEKDKSWWTG